MIADYAGFTRSTRPVFLMLSTFLAIIVPVVIAPARVHGQSFRGEVATYHVIENKGSVHFELAAGQLALFETVESFPFVEGLEIRVKPEGDVRIVPGAFSVHVYEGVDPSIRETSGFTTISGRPAGTALVDGVNRFVVPVETVFDRQRREYPVEGDFRIVNPGLGAVAVQIVPAMKGLSPEMEGLSFQLETTPLLSGLGAIRVGITGTEEIVESSREHLRIYLEGRDVTPDIPVFVSPGIYRLAAEAGDYLDHAENVGIDAARVTTKLLEVREPKVHLKLEVPSVAEVFLDGVRLVPRGREVMEYTPGTYMMMIRIGDFAISRRVVFEPNQEYEIGLDLDILIKQN